jgi:hypothetical protein
MLPTCRPALLPWPERASTRIAASIVSDVASGIHSIFQRLPRLNQFSQNALSQALRAAAARRRQLIGALVEQVAHPSFPDDVRRPNIIHLSMHSGVSMNAMENDFNIRAACGAGNALRHCVQNVHQRPRQTPRGTTFYTCGIHIVANTKLYLFCNLFRWRQELRGRKKAASDAHFSR